MDYQVGDIVKLKKPHPCGSYEWEILRGGEEHAGAEEKRRVRESVRRKKKKFITFSEKVSSEKKSQAIFFGKFC